MEISTILLIISLMTVELAHPTPLDDYVNTPDPHYNYSLVHVYELTGYKLYIINMTSQKWQDGKTLVCARAVLFSILYAN
jgi:hypothetical protein